MGEVQAWRPVLNGVLAPPSSPMSMQSNPHPTDVAKDSWRRAEAATRDVIKSIQPTADSERRRMDVIDYVQDLIKRSLGGKVVPFGSVPLKTYLPDGDIDLTALGILSSEDTLASDVRSVLEVEEQNMHAEFEVKDVQYIHAEVKLVKCLVQNIVVDISFNQIGGLRTLSFLEQVDQLIGKDHIFKRSIILIKAWCYYESRILGAHHGLISTYALETLVLYIFHLFHSSLDGPLAVLYRFLDYYSKFDWDNYCVSLHGPISISSLPELVAEAPENEGGALLLTKEYLKNCAEEFSVPSRGFESNPRTFPQKHLNVVDPLKENNNLGRSVSRANFYRIRSAFTYGARKLGRILLLPSSRIANEVNLFFTNTLDRHGSGDRPDVRDALPNCRSIIPNNHNAVDSAPSDLKATDHDRALSEELKEIKLEMNPIKHSGLQDNGRCLAGDVTSRSSVCNQSRERSNTSLPANEKSKLQSGPYLYTPFLFHAENGHLTGGLSQSAAENFAGLSVSSTRFAQPDSESESSTCSASWLSNHGSLSPNWNANLLRNPHPSDCLSAGVIKHGVSESPDPNKLSDLSGEVELHRRSLHYAQCNQEYMLGTFLLPGVHHSPLYQYPNKHSWDPAWQRSVHANMNANGVSRGPPFSPAGYQPFVPSAYGIEDLRKPRGTGTYFPNVNYRTNYKERQSPGRGKVPALANNLSKQRNNGRAETSQDTHYQEKSSLEPPVQLQLPVINANNHGKMAVLDVAHSVRPTRKETNATGSVFPLEGSLEFGSFRPFPALGTPSTEPGKRSDSVSLKAPGSAQAISASTVPKPSTGTNHERSPKGYQLKDEGDFPPLTG